jgi:ribosomal protein S18 acetylase RimI-like enzyme
VSRTVLRSFNGTLDDARGILAVDRATFNDCPYSPERIVRLLTEPGESSEPSPGLRVWVVEVDDAVAGFVAAFATRTLQADGWEVDLLAVHPRQQGQGLGAALIEQAVSGAAGSGARRARAVTAVKNRASRRAFEAAGFRALPETFHLMRCVVAGAAARPPLAGGEAVRPLAGEAEARQVLELAPASPRTAPEVARLASAGASAFLVAEREGRVAAFIELVRVQTLLYAGAWVESLAGPALSGVEGSRPSEANLLVVAAVEWARAGGLDEVGCLVAARDWRLRQAFVGEGFFSEGEYLVMVRALKREG